MKTFAALSACCSFGLWFVISCTGQRREEPIRIYGRNPFYWEYKGQPVDPLKVDPPSAAPIAAEKIADYLPVMELMKARIDAIALPAGALL